MNQDANKEAANGPGRPAFPSGTPTQPPASGGFKSGLRIAVPLLALVGVVFGVTLFSIYTPPPEDSKTLAPGAPGSSSGSQSSEPPLRFFASTRGWNPPDLSKPGYRHMSLLAPPVGLPSEIDSTKAITFSLQDRTFQTFYEPSGENSPLRRTGFWFENRNPNPVTLQIKHVSCLACSGARLAAIPPETTKNLFQHTALAALPIGAFHGFGVGLVEPAAGLSQLEWADVLFREDPNAKFEVPAAKNPPDPWAPQWGILELQFRAGENPKLPLSAIFASQVHGTQQGGTHNFSLTYTPSNKCEVSPGSIDAGTIDALSGDREYEVLLYSNTRGPGSEFGDLERPSFLVEAAGRAADPVKFVEVTKVQRVPDDELVDLTEQIGRQYNRQTKVRAAYRLTVTFRPKVGETRLDIGLMERVVSVACGDATQHFQVKAAVRGSVWLAGDRTDIELSTFPGVRGHTQSTDLYTEPGVKLEMVKGECKPDPADGDYTYTLEPQPDSGGRGHYKLKITIAPGKVYGRVPKGSDGLVVLEVKGPNPQRLRIPFRGRSNFGE